MTRVLSSLGIFTILLLPVVADAQGVVRMVGLPFEPAGNTSIEVFISSLYRLAIGVAAALAVLRLIMAGAKYILSGLVTSKEAAKQDIHTALIGLLLVLASVLVLNTINPSLTNLQVLNLNQIQVQVQNPSSPGFNTSNSGPLEERTVVDEDDPVAEEKITNAAKNCREAGNSHTIRKVGDQTVVDCYEDDLDYTAPDTNTSFTGEAITPSDGYDPDSNEIRFDCGSFANTSCIEYCDENGGGFPDRDHPHSCHVTVPQYVSAIHCEIDNSRAECRQNDKPQSGEDPIASQSDYSVRDGIYYFESRSDCEAEKNTNDTVVWCLKRIVDGEEVAVPTDANMQPVSLN